jgi:hypothetical protein
MPPTTRARWAAPATQKSNSRAFRRKYRDTILIEGDRTALKFLGELLLAYALSNEHGIQFPRKGAGRARFTKYSTLGFYLHKVPCTEGHGLLARKRVTPKKKATEKDVARR